MGKRDPNKTARNKYIRELKEQKREILPKAIAEISIHDEYERYSTENTLNAFIGSKTGEYLELSSEVSKSPIEYQQKWLEGLKKKAFHSKITQRNPRHLRLFKLVAGDFPNFQQYLLVFLETSYLRHYEEHYKEKPKISESEYWFGANNDVFGILVTPRFRNGVWENDKSEIRKFKYPYWTISHVLETGLCYMNENEIRSFSGIEDYLFFFRDMVRRTASKYQRIIAEKYIGHVKNHSCPESVPLLIPELRFDPLKVRHKYRLDFFTINPWSMSKFGFEISPWSSHGQLKGARSTMKEFNEQAQVNFEKEMAKQKSYWREYGVSYITYTDTDLKDIEGIWREVKEKLDLVVKPIPLDASLLSRKIRI